MREVAEHGGVDVLPVGVHEQRSPIVPAEKAIYAISFFADVLDRGFSQVTAFQERHCTGKAQSLRQDMHSKTGDIKRQTDVDYLNKLYLRCMLQLHQPEASELPAGHNG